MPNETELATEATCYGSNEVHIGFGDHGPHCGVDVVIDKLSFYVPSKSVLRSANSWELAAGGGVSLAPRPKIALSFQRAFDAACSWRP